MLNRRESQFYNKHLLLTEIGAEGQLKLKRAKVLVVGAGGLGCPALSYLTGAGVGEIGIIDRDKVEESNLQRQTLFTYKQIGEFKAQSAASRLKEINPFITLEYFNEQLTIKNAAAIVKKYDIIVDATDNFPARYLINDVCVFLDKPFVFASIDKFQGQLSVFNFKNVHSNSSPTYRCVFPSPPSPGTIPNCSESGVMGVLPGILGSFQANEVIKMITAAGSVMAGKMLLIDILDMRFYTLKIKRDEKNVQNVIDFNGNHSVFYYEDFCKVNREPLNDIRPEEINSIKDFCFVDIRENITLAGIENSVRIPASEIKEKRNYFNPDIKYILYCDYGITSQKVVHDLINLGKKNIFNLTGGLTRWKYIKQSEQSV
jgi:adenylyltransferase/sulfurtransferase